MLSENDLRFPAHCHHRGFWPSRDLLRRLQNFGRWYWRFLEVVADKFLGDGANALFALLYNKDERVWWILSDP